MQTLSFSVCAYQVPSHSTLRYMCCVETLKRFIEKVEYEITIADLYGKTSWDKALVDQIMETYVDLFKELMSGFGVKDPAKKVGNFNWNFII